MQKVVEAAKTLHQADIKKGNEYDDYIGNSQIR
jgi:hypothetical protein